MEGGSWNSDQNDYSIVDHLKLDTASNRLFGTTRGSGNALWADNFQPYELWGDRIHVFVVPLAIDGTIDDSVSGNMVYKQLITQSKTYVTGIDHSLDGEAVHLMAFNED